MARWLSRRYRVAPEPVSRLVQEAWSVGQKAKLDPTLILAIMAVESSFNPFAQSAVGAQGLMQVMTKVHDDKYEAFGGSHAAFDPVTNLRVGVQVLKECIARAGSLEAGLRFYVGAGNLAEDGGYARQGAERAERASASGKSKPCAPPRPPEGAPPPAPPADPPAAAGATQPRDPGRCGGQAALKDRRRQRSRGCATGGPAAGPGRGGGGGAAGGRGRGGGVGGAVPVGGGGGLGGGWGPRGGRAKGTPRRGGRPARGREPG